MTFVISIFELGRAAAHLVTEQDMPMSHLNFFVSTLRRKTERLMLIQQGSGRIGIVKITSVTCAHFATIIFVIWFLYDEEKL